MKKTLIFFLALAGVATATSPNNLLWSMDFGADYGTTKYQINKGSYDFAISESWEFEQNLTDAGLVSSTSSRAHLRGNTGVTWEGGFTFSITFTTPETITSSNNWPVIVSLGQEALRFGPYRANNNYVNMDGSLTTTVRNQYSLTAGTHTAKVTVHNGTAVLRVDDVLACSATLAESLTGSLNDITIGGGNSSNYRMNQTVHSIAMYSVPEPSTATLTLLTLAGMAARRRRK